MGVMSLEENNYQNDNSDILKRQVTLALPVADFLTHNETTSRKPFNLAALSQ